MRLSQTKTDESLERDGVWVAIRYGVEVKVARAGNYRAETWRARLPFEDRRLLENRNLWPGKAERIAEILMDCTAETVLLDWRNVEDDDGNPIPFSVEKAKEVFRDPKLDWFFADVNEAATTRETFFQSEVQELGNSSPKRSAGKRGTPTA